MHYALAVRIARGAEHFDRNRGRPRRRKPAFALDPLRKHGAFDIFEHQKRQFVCLAGIEQSNHVGVRQLARHLRFAQQGIDAAPVLLLLAAEYRRLDGNLSVEAAVEGEVNRTLGAGTQRTLDLEAIDFSDGEAGRPVPVTADAPAALMCRGKPDQGQVPEKNAQNPLCGGRACYAIMRR